MKENRDRTVLIRKDMVEIARNRIVISRATHLDQLSDRLNEDRVRRVILPMILNIEATSNSDDDEYCLDLGIIKKPTEAML